MKFYSGFQLNRKLFLVVKGTVKGAIIKIDPVSSHDEVTLPHNRRIFKRATPG
jgi:hypothetical protein